MDTHDNLPELCIAPEVYDLLINELLKLSNNQFDIRYLYEIIDNRENSEEFIAQKINTLINQMINQMQNQMQNQMLTQLANIHVDSNNHVDLKPHCSHFNLEQHQNSSKDDSELKNANQNLKKTNLHVESFRELKIDDDKVIFESNSQAGCSKDADKCLQAREENFMDIDQQNSMESLQSSLRIPQNSTEIAQNSIKSPQNAQSSMEIEQNSKKTPQNEKEIACSSSNHKKHQNLAKNCQHSSNSTGINSTFMQDSINNYKTHYEYAKGQNFTQTTHKTNHLMPHINCVNILNQNHFRFTLLTYNIHKLMRFACAAISFLENDNFIDPNISYHTTILLQEVMKGRIKIERIFQINSNFFDNIEMRLVHLLENSQMMFDRRVGIIKIIAAIRRLIMHFS